MVYVNTKVKLVDGRLHSRQSHFKHRCEEEIPTPAGIWTLVAQPGIINFNDGTSSLHFYCNILKSIARISGSRGRSLSSGRVKNFLFSTSSRQALGSTQPPIQWVLGALFPGVKRPGVKLTTHIKLVLRSRKCGCIHPFPHTPSWRSA
jgi:hypothetical protein